MLYNGQSYPVDIDNVKQLADKGIAILVIEKEGIADVLVSFCTRIPYCISTHPRKAYRIW